MNDEPCRIVLKRNPIFVQRSHQQVIGLLLLEMRNAIVLFQVDRGPPQDDTGTQLIEDLREARIRDAVVAASVERNAHRTSREARALLLEPPRDDGTGLVVERRAQVPGLNAIGLLTLLIHLE